jgi:hypothetical protein
MEGEEELMEGEEEGDGRDRRDREEVGMKRKKGALRRPSPAIRKFSDPRARGRRHEHGALPVINKFVWLLARGGARLEHTHRVDTINGVRRIRHDEVLRMRPDLPPQNDDK